MLPLDLMEASELALRKLSAHLVELEATAAPVAHTVMVVTTAVEAYVDGLLRELINTSAMTSSPFGRALLSEVNDEFHNSWGNRYKWLSRGFGITLQGSRPSQEFDVLVELRNALVHGGGWLTRRQKVSIRGMIELEKRFANLLMVEAGGGSLRLVPETASTAVNICRGFVIFADRTTRSSIPSLEY